MWKCLTLCIVLTLCRDARGDIGNQMAEVIQKCCDDGSAHARSHSGENCNIPSAPADVPAAFGSLCVMAQAECCREYYKKKDSCDSGLDLALSTGKCTGSKDFTKVCCDECSQGSAAGLAGGAEACVSKAHANSAEGLLADDAFLKCCMKTAKEGPPKITPKPEVIIASVCEDYAPNELCAHHCIPIPGSYKCECNPGFMLMADGRNCREVVKNRCKPRNPCQHKCNDNGVDVLCSCRRGYELMPDGKSCQDINECQLDIPVCLAGTQCHNVQGSYRCINLKKTSHDQPKGQCPPGFARNLKNNVCDDINECKLPRPPCPAYLCQNTVGGYKCGGVSGDPVNLTPRTTDVEDRCPPGFALGNSGECEDVDECAIMTDDCNRLSQYCVNTHSSFYCQDMVSKLCQPGFKIDAMTNRCEDINECEDHAICKSDQICVNQPGQYVCKQRPPQTRPSNGECPDGMRLDPATHACDDIDECVEGTHLCDQHQNCHNSVGSYQCDCKLGFELDTTTGACVDVNECASHQHDCMMNSQRCDNTIGSYLCIRITSCGTGYILQHATGKCEDNDECALGTHNCAIAGPEYQCINIPGSFRCVKKRVSTTTTTAAPEYEYEYYDSDEEIDQPSTNKTEPAPVNTSSSSPPSSPPSSTEVPPPEVNKPEEHPVEPKQEPTPEEPIQEPATADNQLPTERKPIDYIAEVPRYIAPLYTSPEPETTSPETTTPITYSEPEQNRPDIVYEPNSEPPERNTPDLTYYETKPDKPISSNEISPTEREPGTEQTPPRRNGSGRTYSPYRPTPRYEDRHGVNINVNDCPNGFEVYSNGGCFDIDECASNRHSCSGLTETCRNLVGGYVCDCAPGFRRDLYNGACVHVITTSSTTTSSKDLLPPTLPELPLIPPSPPTFPPTPPTFPPTPPTLPITPPTLPPTLPTLPPTPPTLPTEPPTLPPTPPTLPTTPPTLPTTPPTLPPTPPTLPPTPPTLPTTPPTLPTEPPTLPTTPPTLPPTTTPEPVSSTTQKARELFFGYRDDRPQYTRPFRPRSSCDAGFYLNAQTNTCEDINECTNGQANCAVVEICVNTRGGYRCECPPNWRLDDIRHRCVPIRNNGLFPPGYGNEPVYPPTDQEAVGHGFEKTNFVNPEITQVEDRGAVLKCPWGYRLGDDNTCVDVDECATGEAKCGIQQICTNLAGGYTCSCPRGHRLVGDHECEDVDECVLAGNSSICSRNADCVNTIGSYQCKCHTGFRPAPVNDKVCVDVDECSEARAGSLCQHRCNNVWGSYRCSCHRGYRLSADNRTCVDVDECVQFKSKLPCVGKCLNEPGSYRCACPIGYRLSEDKRSCIDIDECETGEAGCQTGIFGGTSHVCSNTRGSYHCQQITCPRGYKLEGKHRCTKTQRVCMVGDWECAHQPTTISYNFITFVSKLYVPDANVKLFTMRGPAWPYTELTFQLRLVNINAPPSVKDKADINAFLLTQNGHEAVISLVQPLEGPQSIELELSMELHNREQFGGIAIAKVFIYVSEYEF